jgi:hypothetical protein
MSALDINSILRGCHLYCVKDCLANTYIQNVIKEDALPKFDRDDFCFYFINKEEESFKVSSIVSVSKPDYVEKLPFKPLPPKEESKKKKRSKRRDETVSSLKHVAPIIDYDDSELDDVLMPITYVSDHDWEKHSTFNIENLFGTNSKNYEVNNCCTISVVTKHTTTCCSIQVIDITLVKYQFTNITSLRVVQQKYSGLYSSTEYYKP